MSGIFDHILDRSLAHIPRFSSFPQQSQESVAEHSFFVAYFSTIVAYHVEKQRIPVDMGKLISMALVHDREEQFSGDILSPFKHYSEKITSTIREVNKEVLRQSFEGLPEELTSRYSSLWVEEAEGKTIEAQIVKIADRLSLLSKCKEEADVGSLRFEKIYQDELESLKVYPIEWWQKIKSEILP